MVYLITVLGNHGEGENHRLISQEMDANEHIRINEQDNNTMGHGAGDNMARGGSFIHMGCGTTVVVGEENNNANMQCGDETNVNKFGSVIDSVEVFGQWIIGRTSRILVEPHEPVYILNLLIL